MILILTVFLLTNIVFAYNEIDKIAMELRPVDNTNPIDTEILAASNGTQIILNSKFDDIEKATYEKEILKLVADEVIKKYGDFSYNPEDVMTGYDALGSLIRFNGVEAQVQQNVIQVSNGLDKETVDELYNQEYLNQSRAAGIILPDEEIVLNAPITKAMLSNWVFRVSNLEAQYNDLSQVYDFKDFEQVDVSYRSAIQALLNEGIIEVDENGNFNPREEITKDEFANIINKLVENSYEERNITSNYGVIVNITETNENNEIIKNYFIKNSDGITIKLIVKNNMVNDKSNDFIVYKDNALALSSDIKIGDEINYFTKNGEVNFVDVINDNSILSKIEKLQKSDENSNFLLSTVKEISDENYNDGINNIDRTRIRMLAIDGNTYDLIIDTDTNTNIRKDVLTFKGQNVISATKLQVGDSLSLLVKNYSEVIYIKTLQTESQWIDGTIRNIDQSSVELFDYNNKINTYPILKNCSVEINRRPGSISDLGYGQDVLMRLDNGYITFIDVETFLNPGYIPEFGKTQIGEVYEKFNDRIVFLLNTGNKELYSVDNDTIILKGGELIHETSLKEGDKVKLFFNDIYTEKIAKIEVEGSERLVKRIYKGNLKSFNQASMTLVINNPEYLKNIEWIPMDNYYKQISLDDNVEIYNKNEIIDNKHFIERFRDKEIYVVVENAYDNDINRVVNKFELENKQNVNYNNGTIIIKEGRVVSYNALNADDTVLVVSERENGINEANLVKITPINENKFNNIYFGTLKDVNFNSITLDNHAFVEDNKISNVSTSTSDNYYCFTETNITDITDPDDFKNLNIHDLFNGKYSEEENEEKHTSGVDYKKYYGYLITDGNNGVISMKIRHKGLLEGENFDDTNSSVSRANDDFEDTLDKMIITKGMLNESISNICGGRINEN